MTQSPLFVSGRRFIATLAVLCVSAPVQAIIPDEGSAAADKLFMAPELYILNWPQPVAELSPELQQALASDLAALDVAPGQAFFDLRSGKLNSLILARPMVPGPGLGNSLSWNDLGIAPPSTDAEYGNAALAALESYLAANGAALGVDATQFEAEPSVGVLDGRRITQINIGREVDGIPVRFSALTATLNSGNLLLLGTTNWGAIDVSTAPSMTAGAAEAAVAGHLAPFSVSEPVTPTHLELIAKANGSDPETVTPGEGYTYRLAWVVTVEADGVYGTFEGLVDAHSGELMAVTDVNQYLTRRTVGGIFPVSNDGLCKGANCAPGLIPDGVEQPGHPMPFATVTFPDGSSAMSNGAGLGDFNGPFRTALTGQYVSMVDTCGFIDEGTVCTDLDLGVSGGTDCVTPAFSDSLGNTHSSRTGYYELNQMIGLFRSRIDLGDPAYVFVNGLPTPVRAEMNIDQNCNANFSPTTLDINFFTSGVSGSNVCRNTGEIAAVFDHEWGHFMDFIDGNGLSSPSEAYGDIAGIARLNDSCIGRGFFEDNSIGGFCFGDGDPCTECSGVREDDFLKRQSQQPHDVDWANGSHATIPGGCGAGLPVPIPSPGIQTGPCGGSVHCNGSIVGEAFFDLLSRDLRCQGAGGWENVPGDGSGPVQGGQCAGGPPTLDVNSALELATLMFVQAKGNIGFWFQCNNAVGGCGADSGYHQLLAANDDNGSFFDGTPNHDALFAAFDRHQVACPASAPPVINASCPLGIPGRVENLVVTPGVSSASLDWDAVAGASEYWVYRTEGVLGCEQGKKRIAILDAAAGSAYIDMGLDNPNEGDGTTIPGLLDGFEYFYTVLAVGAPGCVGQMAECASAVPASPGGDFAGDASVGIEQGTTAITSGDGDEFLDNCESASIGMTVANDGGTDLTNVQVVAVQATSPAGVQVTVNTPLPINLGNLASACGQPGFAATSIHFTVDSGLSHDDQLILEVSVLADEFSGTPQTGILVVGETENDFEITPEILFDFEDGSLQGWSVEEGTFDNTNVPPPGADLTLQYMASSAFEDFACDKIRSPKLRLTSTSTLSLFNQFITENEAPGGVFIGFYDRANVGIIDGQGVRALIEPDGGREYNAFTNPAGTYAGCNEPELGWATGPEHGPDLGASWGESTWTSEALDAGSYVDQTVRIEVINATDSTASGRGLWFDQVRITDVKLRAADGFSDVCEDNPDPDEDCDLCANGKPSELTLTYRGGDCSASDNSQGKKDDCEDFAGGPPPSNAEVYIVADDDSDGDDSDSDSDSDRTWFSGEVFPDQAFTLQAVNGDKDDFGSKVFVHIYDFEGGSLLQTVEIHTSCSAPLIEGERFGSVETGDGVNAGACEGPSTPSGRVHGSGYLAGLLSDDDSDSDSDKVNFSFDAKFYKGALKGKLKLKDKEADVEIDAKQIDSLSTGDGTCNGVPTGAGAFEFTATGTFESGGVEVEGATFRVCGEDSGKHGKAKDGQPADRLYVECLSGCSYDTASRTPDDGIDGGNIHLHDPIVGSDDDGGDAGGAGGSMPGGSGVVELLEGVTAVSALSGAPLTLDAQLDRPLGLEFDQVPVTLHWRSSLGASGSLQALTDNFGLATFVTAIPLGETEYWVTVGELDSNRVEIQSID